MGHVPSGQEDHRQDLPGLKKGSWRCLWHIPTLALSFSSSLSSDMNAHYTFPSSCLILICIFRSKLLSYDEKWNYRGVYGALSGHLETWGSCPYWWPSHFHDLILLLTQKRTSFSILILGKSHLMKSEYLIFIWWYSIRVAPKVRWMTHPFVLFCWKE